MAKMPSTGPAIAIALAAVIAAGVIEKYSKQRNATPKVEEVTIEEAKPMQSLQRDRRPQGWGRPVPEQPVPVLPGRGAATERTITEIRPLISAVEVSHNRPVRPYPVIRRVNENQCMVIAPGAVLYDQGGITRAISAPFPCPTIGLARERWGSGTRSITVVYADDEIGISEVWP